MKTKSFSNLNVYHIRYIFDMSFKFRVNNESLICITDCAYGVVHANIYNFNG